MTKRPERTYYTPKVLQPGEMLCPKCSKTMSNKRGAKCPRCDWKAAK